MTATTSLVVLDITTFDAGLGRTGWSVFNAMTGEDLETGRATSHEAAELAAARAISARTLHVRTGRDCWTVEIPELGAVPLPLSSRATLDQALAHVRSLPLAFGKQVHG